MRTTLITPAACIALMLLAIALPSCKQEPAEEPYRNFWTIDNQVHGTMDTKYKIGPVLNMLYYLRDAASGDSILVRLSVGYYVGGENLRVLYSGERSGDGRHPSRAVGVYIYRKRETFENLNPTVIGARVRLVDTVVSGTALKYEVLELAPIILSNRGNPGERITLGGSFNLSRRSAPNQVSFMQVDNSPYEAIADWSGGDCDWVVGYYAAEGSGLELRFSSRPEAGARFRIGQIGCEAADGVVDVRYHHDAETAWYRPSYDSAMLGRELIVEDYAGLLGISLQGVTMKEPRFWEQRQFMNARLFFTPF